MEREGVSTLFIRSFLWALRCLAHVLKISCALCVLKTCFENALVWRFALRLTLVSVLKSFNKANVFETCF